MERHGSHTARQDSILVDQGRTAQCAVPQLQLQLACRLPTTCAGAALRFLGAAALPFFGAALPPLPPPPTPPPPPTGAEAKVACMSGFVVPALPCGKSGVGCAGRARRRGRLRLKRAHCEDSRAAAEKDAARCSWKRALARIRRLPAATAASAAAATPSPWYLRRQRATRGTGACVCRGRPGRPCRLPPACPHALRPRSTRHWRSAAAPASPPRACTLPARPPAGGGSSLNTVSPSGRAGSAASDCKQGWGRGKGCKGAGLASGRVTAVDRASGARASREPCAAVSHPCWMCPAGLARCSQSAQGSAPAQGRAPRQCPAGAGGRSRQAGMEGA